MQAWLGPSQALLACRARAEVRLSFALSLTSVALSSAVHHGILLASAGIMLCPTIVSSRVVALNYGLSFTCAHGGSAGPCI